MDATTANLLQQLHEADLAAACKGNIHKQLSKAKIDKKQTGLKSALTALGRLLTIAIQLTRAAPAEPTVHQFSTIDDELLKTSNLETYMCPKIVAEIWEASGFAYGNFLSSCNEAKGKDCIKLIMDISGGAILPGCPLVNLYNERTKKTDNRLAGTPTSRNCWGPMKTKPLPNKRPTPTKLFLTCWYPKKLLPIESTAWSAALLGILLCGPGQLAAGFFDNILSRVINAEEARNLTVSFCSQSYVIFIYLSPFLESLPFPSLESPHDGAFFGIPHAGGVS